MTLIPFFKYIATGNDFIVIDNRAGSYTTGDSELWKNICLPKFGIGADGVLFLENGSNNHDFKMRYINADGGEVEMCGNGARAITAFFHEEITSSKKQFYTFETMNGSYMCQVDEKYGYKLKMTEFYDFDKIDLRDIESELQAKKSLYLNTGVPHCVFEVNNVDSYQVFQHGKLVRHQERFKKGSNANFYEVLKKNHIKVRTYERGVENETLSCGTGVTAAARSAAYFHHWEGGVLVETLGGQLFIDISKDNNEIFLCGPAKKIFSGNYF